MTKPRTFRHTLLSTVLLTALAAGCGGDKPESLIASGKDFLAKNDNKAATIQFKNALQQNPNLGEARFLLGKALLDSGDMAGAEIELRKALELKYPTDQAAPPLARALLGTGQAKKVTDEFASLELPTGEPAASLKTTLSQAYLAQGNSEASATALAAALAAQPDYAPALLASARKMAANKDISGALTVVDGILSKTPDNHETLLFKGSLLAAQGDQSAALDFYHKAVNARPDFLLAHSAIIGSLLQQGKLDDAAKQVDTLKKIAPKHPQTVFLETQLAYQRKDYNTARELSQQLLKLSPNNPGTLQLAGSIEYQLRSYLQAESYLSQALQQAPQLPIARRLLIASYLRSGQPAKALSTLQPFLNDMDKDATMLSLAGQVYLQNGDAKRAEEYFTKASQLDPSDPKKRTSMALAHMAQGEMSTALGELEEISASDKGTSADMAMIATYLRRNEADKALKAIEVLEAKQPDNPATYNLRAGALLGKKDVAGARKSFEKALSINPSYFPAAMALARMDLAEKKPEEARKRFEAVLAADPKNVAAMLALADLRIASGGTPNEVAELLNKAVSANPTELEPRLALINYYLRIQEAKKAVGAAQDAHAAMPDKPEILDALGKSQEVSGDFNQALAAYGKLAVSQPASPLAQMRMANVHLTSKNQEEAIKSLRKALEIKPDLLEAQRALILIALESKKPEDALAVARQVQKQRPKEAIGMALEGDIQAAGQHWPEAASAYRSALKLAAAPELAIKLHSVYLAEKNRAEAEKTAAAWLKDHPKDVAFRFHLADVALASKDYTTAAQYYRAAVDIQPNNPLALNNLAWASGQLKSPRAIEYAEKANQLAPNQPAFMDTLAMLMAAKGDTAGAITLLKKAVEIAPQAAAIRLNLAKLLLSAGRKDEARTELDTLAKLGDKFPGQVEVGRLQKDL